MRKSLKELIEDFSNDTSDNIENYLPFLKESDTFHFFTLEAGALIEEIEWLEHVFVYNYLFKTEPDFSAIMRLGIENEQLTSLALPNTDFIELSIADEESHELVVSAEIEINNNSILRLTFFNLTISINGNDLFKQVEKKRDGTLEIKEDENFNISIDLELTQTTSGDFSFELQELDTYFTIADTGIIISLKSIDYSYANLTHTLILENAGITLPVAFLKKAEKSDNSWQITDEPVMLESTLELTQSSTNGLNLTAQDMSTSFAIGNTGLIVSVTNLTLSTDGLSFESATLVPPPFILDVFQIDNLELSITGATINEDGFSGTVSDTSEYSKMIDDLTYKITKIEFEFEDNKLKTAVIQAEIVNHTSATVITIITDIIIDDENKLPVTFKITIDDIPLHLEFPPLKNVKKDSNHNYTIEDTVFLIDAEVDAVLGNSTNANLTIELDNCIFALADTEIIVEMGLVQFNSEDEDNYISTSEATVVLPTSLCESENGENITLTLSDPQFNSQGFSGTFDGDGTEITLLGLKGELSSIIFENNIPTEITFTIEDGTDVTISYEPQLVPPFAFALGTTFTIPLPPLKAVTIPEDDADPYSYSIEDENFALMLNAEGAISANGIDASAKLDTQTHIAFAINTVIVHIQGGTYNEQNQIAQLETAKIILPDLEELDLPELSLTNSKIDCVNIKFSGIVAIDWELAYNDDTNTFSNDVNNDINLFGIPGGIEHIALIFKDNALTGSDINGKLLIPYFDQPAEIRINLQMTDNGLDFTIVLKALGEEAVELRKEELIALYIRSLELKKEGQIASFIINGGMQPLLMASDGLEWPRLDVKNLTIEQDLDHMDVAPILKFEEAWVDLKELATVDLWGFHFELNRIGMGYEETGDKLWIDLTGSIKLMPQIPAGVEAKGFRITWPRDIQFNNTPPSLDEIIDVASRLEIKFDGIYLEYGVPGTVEFEGLIRFIKETQKVGFAGDMVLRVPATGLEIEAGLMIGMNFQAPPYPFLYMYFGIELPAGIPIAQSGLALKGAKGMFGLNVKPDKSPEENWYYDWYKRGPIEGAHPTNKWTDAKDAVAFGAGLTITTADGTLMGVRGLMVIALPGPFLMIEGTALVFDGVLPSAPLKALAIFDGAENSVQFNLAAEAEIVEDVLEAHGGLEAFFDFDDVTKWHLYLGENTPEERRIQANILKIGEEFLFNANAYLMIDMQDADTVRARLGAFIGFKPKIPKVGPVSITADVTIEGDGAITINPVYFDGNLTLNAQLKATVAGVGIQAIASANANVEGPEPVIFDAMIKASIELPFELADLESVPIADDIISFLDNVVDIPEIPPLEIEVKFHWKSDEIYEPVSPLVDVSMENYFLQQAVTLEKESVLVGMDHRPVLIFDQDMNVDASVNTPIVGTPGNTTSSYKHGDISYASYLHSIVISEKSKHEVNWKVIASTNPVLLDGEPLSGVWRIDPNVENPKKASKRNLKLWSTFPFANVYTGNDNSIVQQMLTRVEDVYQTVKCIEEQTSRDFSDSKMDEGYLGTVFTYENIRFEADSISYENGELILSHDQDSSVKIIFSETILDLELELGSNNGNTIKYITICRDNDTNCEKNVSFSNNPQDTLRISNEEGFTSVEIKDEAYKETFSVKNISYSTQADKTAYALCEDQNDKLNEMFPSLISDPVPVLQADSSYKIEIKTKINDVIQEKETYKFHTEGAPNRLDRYIKYSYPHMEQKHIFLNDTFNIRFKRSWIKALYDPDETRENNPYALDVYLKDAKGSFVPNVTMDWIKAQSATLTPDEQKWYDYIAPDTFTFPLDDEIRITDAQWTEVFIYKEVFSNNFHVEESILRDNERVTELRRTNLLSNNSKFFGSSINRNIPGRVNNKLFISEIKKKKKSEIISLQEGVYCSDSFQYEIFCKNQSSTDLFGLVFSYQNKENYYRFVVDIKNNSCKLERIIDTKTKFTETKTFDIKIKDIHILSIQREKATFKLKINNQLLIEHAEKVLSNGRIGTLRSTHGTVVFNVLKPLSRYELILAGGNGGRAIYSSQNIKNEIKQLCQTTSDNDTQEIVVCSEEIVKKSISKLCTDIDNWEIQSTSIKPSIDSVVLFFDKISNQNIDLRVDFTKGNDHGVYISIKRNKDKKIIDYIKVVLTDNNKLEVWKKNSKKIFPEIRRATSLRIENRDFAVDIPSYKTINADILLGEIDLISPSTETDLQTVRINIFNAVIKIFWQGKMLQINNSENLSGELGLFASNRGQRFNNLSIREAEVLKIPFMTSSFYSLRELLDSTQYYNIQITENFILPVNEYKNFIKSQLEYEKSKIDLRNAIKNIGDVEADKAVFKNAKMLLDDHFATISPESLYYEDPVNHVEVYKLKQNNKIQHLYLRSPEPLQLKYHLEETSMTVGKVNLEVKDGLGNNIHYSHICSSGGNQVLLRLKQSVDENMIIDFYIQ